MYYKEMTNGARRAFIEEIMENEERDWIAVAMVQKFVNDELSTDDIERICMGRMKNENGRI